METSSASWTLIKNAEEVTEKLENFLLPIVLPKNSEAPKYYLKKINTFSSFIPNMKEYHQSVNKYSLNTIQVHSLAIGTNILWYFKKECFIIS